MADYEERSLDDLTEEPTAHKVEELRKKGVVAQSRELTGTIALIGVVIAIYFMTGRFIHEFTDLLRQVFSKDLVKPMEIQDWRSFTDIGLRCGKLLLFSFLPIGFTGLVLAVIASLAQVGFVVSSETLNPDFNRVNPVSGFMRVFSTKSLVEGIKSVLKFVVIGGVAYASINAQIYMIPSSTGFGVTQIMHYIGDISTRAFATTIALLLGLSVFDYWIQWRNYRKQAMMTKSEAKQEMKEREGDPQIKARIRTIQRDAARKRMMKAVPKADVIITNPTHFAVAIVYSPEENVAPRVVAKGADFLAQRIKEIARQNGIPTVENKPLARTLYKHVKVGQMIPRSLYQAVAEILAYVYKLKGRKFGQPSARV